MNNLQLLTTEELENTKGGVGLAEIVAISGVANFFVSVFNAGYKFGADLALRHQDRKTVEKNFNCFLLVILQRY